MNFFRRLFGGKGQSSEPVKSPPKEEKLAFIFLFEKLPVFDQESLSNKLESFGRLYPPLKIFDDVAGEGAFHKKVSFDQHTLRLVGFDLSAPEHAVKPAIDTSHWQQEDKEPLRQHKAHVICYYESGDANPAEQIIAILKLAGAFLDDTLVGAVDSGAWTCMPPKVIKDMLAPEMLASSRVDIPLGLWTGFVKMFNKPDEVWFCSKGFHRWGVQDFAFFGKLAQADEAFGIFGQMFNYVRNSKAVLKAGHTAELGDNLYVKFSAVTEYRDYLEGPMGTLVVEKITREQIRK